MKLLLMVMAAVEFLAGVPLMFAPAYVVPFVLNTPLDTPAGVVVARLAGAALITIAVACWTARGGERGGPASGVVAAMLFYNAAAAAVLVYAGVRLGLQSAFIWPAILLHVALALWCLLNVRITNRKLSKAETVEPVSSDS